MKEKMKNIEKHCQKLSFDMAEFAAKYPNDMIANALCNTAEKIANLGKPFAQKLQKQDLDVVRFFVKQTGYREIHYD